MPRYAIVEAPSALGHVPEHLGVERAPEVLLAAGLADGLAARRAGRVGAAGYRADRDPGTLVMNPQAIRDYSSLLADAATAVLGEGEFPVVLGGDCSILLGTMLALRRRGRYGLLYIDGDADFYQPEVNPLNGAASASDLAFATGFGPDVVTDIEGRRPLVRAEDVVVFACRDAADRERRGCQPLPAGMLVIDRDQVRRVGGIPEADPACVFDMAWRGTHDRGSDKDSGAGLGLAIVRSIVEAHQGQVSVVNTKEGCRFEVRLPTPDGSVRYDLEAIPSLGLVECPCPSRGRADSAG